MSKFLKDLFERTISTYIQVFLGLLLAGASDTLDVSTLKAAAVSAIPAALAVIKGLVGQKFGEADSAAWLPEDDAHVDESWDQWEDWSEETPEGTVEETE